MLAKLKSHRSSRSNASSSTRGGTPSRHSHHRPNNNNSNTTPTNPNNSNNNNVVAGLAKQRQQQQQQQHQQQNRLVNNNSSSSTKRAKADDLDQLDALALSATQSSMSSNAASSNANSSSYYTTSTQSNHHHHHHQPTHPLLSRLDRVLNGRDGSYATDDSGSEAVYTDEDELSASQINSSNPSTNQQQPTGKDDHFMSQIVAGVTNSLSLKDIAQSKSSSSLSGTNYTTNTNNDGTRNKNPASYSFSSIHQPQPMAKSLSTSSKKSKAKASPPSKLHADARFSRMVRSNSLDDDLADLGGNDEFGEDSSGGNDISVTTNDTKDTDLSNSNNKTPKKPWKLIRTTPSKKAYTPTKPSSTSRQPNQQPPPLVHNTVVDASALAAVQMARQTIAVAHKKQQLELQQQKQNLALNSANKSRQKLDTTYASSPQQEQHFSTGIMCSPTPRPTTATPKKDLWSSASAVVAVASSAVDKINKKSKSKTPVRPSMRHDTSRSSSSEDEDDSDESQDELRKSHAKKYGSQSKSIHLGAEKTYEKKEHEDDNGSEGSAEDYSDDEDEGEDGYKPGGYHAVKISEVYNQR